jgi:hypothetical protein
MPAGQNTMSPRVTGQPARPYEGAWPNTNSLPQRQNPNVYTGMNDDLDGYNSGNQSQRRNPNVQINGRSPESLEMMGINPNSQYGGSAQSGSNGFSGSSNDQSGNSLPMYPFAPNR